MQANLPLGSMRTLGSCGYNMVQACCYRPEIYANATEFVWEGGYISGTSLLIEERSTVMCKYNSTGSALCGCGVSTQKFDLDKSTCISWCESGKVWIPSTDPVECDSYLSVPGRCESCERGTHSSASLDWLQTCKPCAMGSYSGELGSSECLECEENTHAQELGASECLSCPTGNVILFLLCVCVCVCVFYFFVLNNKTYQVDTRTDIEVQSLVPCATRCT